MLLINTPMSFALHALPRDHDFKARPHNHVLVHEDTEWRVNKACNDALFTNKACIRCASSSRTLYTRYLVSSRTSTWSCGRAFRDRSGVPSFRRYEIMRLMLGRVRPSIAIEKTSNRIWCTSMPANTKWRLFMRYSYLNYWPTLEFTLHENNRCMTTFPQYPSKDFLRLVRT